MKKKHGKSGGVARAKKLSAKRRSEIATVAAKARWQKRNPEVELETAWKIFKALVNTYIKPHRVD